MMESPLKANSMERNLLMSAPGPSSFSAAGSIYYASNTFTGKSPNSDQVPSIGVVHAGLNTPGPSSQRDVLQNESVSPDPDSGLKIMSGNLHRLVSAPLFSNNPLLPSDNLVVPTLQVEDNEQPLATDLGTLKDTFNEVIAHSSPIPSGSKSGTILGKNEGYLKGSVEGILEGQDMKGVGTGTGTVVDNVTKARGIKLEFSAKGEEKERRGTESGKEGSTVSKTRMSPPPVVIRI